jgi:hypothetical protein
MRRGFSPLARGTAAGSGLLILLAVIGLSAVRGFAERSIDLDRVYSNQFPVRVDAVVFDAGGRMDDTNAVGFGAWSVRFAKKNPSAYYQCEDPCVGYPPPVLSIGGLVCENPDLGQTSCRLTISIRDHRADECTIRGDRNDAVSIPIDCPVSLEAL